MRRRCITIDADLDDWLVATARATRRPVSGIVQLALLAAQNPPLGGASPGRAESPAVATKDAAPGASQMETSP